jgi:hypothetical protein
MADAQTATDEAGLYDRDFVRWTEEQAAALRSVAAGGNARLDYENLIEEIESLGGALKHELASRIATIIEHLLKLEFSPAALPEPGWRSTIRRERRMIEELLDENPSLRVRVPSDVARTWRRVARQVAGDLADRGEDAASTTVGALGTAPRYREREVLGDEWFPERVAD